MTRMISATIEGQTYQIPSMWLCGATRNRTLRQALQVWHEQSQMEGEVTK